MKKAFALIALLITTISCSTDSSNEMVNIPLKNSNFSTKAEILESYDFEVQAKGNDGNLINGKLTITIDEPTGDLIRVELSQNILNGTDLDSNFLAVSNFQVTADEHDHKTCIEDCIKKYTDPITGEKIRGRGWCKAGCWGKTVIQVAEAVVTLILVSSGS